MQAPQQSFVGPVGHGLKDRLDSWAVGQSGRQRERRRRKLDGADGMLHQCVVWTHPPMVKDRSDVDPDRVAYYLSDKEPGHETDETGLGSRPMYGKHETGHRYVDPGLFASFPHRCCLAAVASLATPTVP